MGNGEEEEDASWKDEGVAFFLFIESRCRVDQTFRSMHQEPEREQLSVYLETDGGKKGRRRCRVSSEGVVWRKERGMLMSFPEHERVGRDVSDIAAFSIDPLISRKSHHHQSITTHLNMHPWLKLALAGVVVIPSTSLYTFERK